MPDDEVTSPIHDLKESLAWSTPVETKNCPVANIAEVSMSIGTLNQGNQPSEQTKCKTRSFDVEKSLSHQTLSPTPNVVHRSERRGLLANLLVIPEVDDPYLYSNKKKWLITFVVSMGGMAAPGASNIFYRMSSLQVANSTKQDIPLALIDTDIWQLHYLKLPMISTLARQLAICRWQCTCSVWALPPCGGPHLVNDWGADPSMWCHSPCLSSFAYSVQSAPTLPC